MTFERLQFGQSGEDLAIQYLEGKGYKVLKQNYKNKLGEIDIIAEYDSTLVFVEVKTRDEPEEITALESVTFRKQRKILNVAMSYLQRAGGIDQDVRFDVIAVYAQKDEISIEHIESAFEAS